MDDDTWLSSQGTKLSWKCLPLNLISLPFIVAEKAKVVHSSCVLQSYWQMVMMSLQTISYWSCEDERQRWIRKKLVKIVHSLFDVPLDYFVLMLKKDMYSGRSDDTGYEKILVFMIILI